MYPSTHFITSLILAILLYPVFGFYSLLVFIGGFLIDVDHNLWYIYKKKDLNPINAYNYYISKEHKKDKYLINIFHVVEFWIIVLILSFYSEVIRIIAYGMVLHLALDIYDMIKRGWYSARIISLILQWHKVPW